MTCLASILLSHLKNAFHILKKRLCLTVTDSYRSSEYPIPNKPRKYSVESSDNSGKYSEESPDSDQPHSEIILSKVTVSSQIRRIIGLGTSHPDPPQKKVPTITY
ncbi:hypothetical protein AVEN_135379-1 [Araneus ventricosus]|uniref:Uncharacterized protein n=1 Tax=Araneus ventricosus TaxID=182803 RepID=A0A4Y2N432_ARAVE|nr:hypothetical protein AVEN_135379-1 [Araneus ventricosus]